MKCVRYLASVVSLTVFSSPLLAHPLHTGVEAFTTGFSHPFLGIDHLLAMVALGMWIAYLTPSARRRIPLVFVPAIVGGGLCGLVGGSLPAFEPLLAASVLALGLLVMTQKRLGPVAALPLVALFALLHGFAHASALLPSLATLAYATGFSLATGTLIVFGFAVGLRLATNSRAATLAGFPIASAGCVLVAHALL